MSIKIEHREEFVNGEIVSESYLIRWNESDARQFTKNELFELKAKLKDYEI